jgi:hypothetical protein
LVMFRWGSAPAGATCKPGCCVKYLDNPIVTLTHDYAPGQILAFVVCQVELESQS